MTETNAKIHVLADETLGGIKREYVEVDRKAAVGDLIANGELIGKFRYNSGIFTHVYYDGAYGGEDAWYTNKCRVLEPTDIVHIDGPDGTTQRYELTDRKAEVGEKVMYVNESGESYGIVTEVIAAGAGVVDVAEYEEPSGAVVVGFSHDRYRVLVPVETAEADEPQPVDTVFAIGNVAQEVAKLKRTVVRLINEIDTLHKDNRTLGEELARLKQDGNTQQPTGTSFADFCEGYIAYSKALKEAQS